VLIVSSVTVVMGWASLKMNQFGRYRMFQAITILCAFIFVCVKSYEYRDKFTHYEVIRKDGTVVDGHLVAKTKEYIEIHPMASHTEQTASPTAAGHEGEAKSAEAHAADKEAGKTGETNATGAQKGAATATAHAAGGHETVRIPMSDVKKAESYGPWHNTYLAIYFTLTGLHALHVIGGALVIGYIWGPGAKMWKTDPERYTNRVEVSGLFWHFVDLVWIFLFPVLYLL
jgi:cytochrome c oxidase subunit III